MMDSERKFLEFLAAAFEAPRLGTELFDFMFRGLGGARERRGVGRVYKEGRKRFKAIRWRLFSDATIFLPFLPRPLHM